MEGKRNYQLRNLLGVKQSSQVKELKVALPLLRQQGGPKIFLKRLRDSIDKQKLARTCNFLNPLHDIGLYASIARNYYKKPYVLRVDGIYFDIKSDNNSLNKPIFDSIKSANGLILQSDFNRHLVQSFYGDLIHNIIVINNGAVINKKNRDYKKVVGLPKNKKIIMCSSHWRRHKRLEENIEVFNELNKIDNDFILLVLGKNAKIPFNSKNIIYEGEIKPAEIYEYYKLSDLFLHLSWLDNCPNAVVEAIANGIPVVCSNQGGTKELVEGANAGIVSQCDQDVELGLVDLYNPPKPDIRVVVNDIFKVFDNYEYYRNRIDYEFVDIANIARKYVSFINEVVDENKIQRI